jgi:hypothetical protein
LVAPPADLQRYTRPLVEIRSALKPRRRVGPNSGPESKPGLSSQVICNSSLNEIPSVPAILHQLRASRAIAQVKQ